MLCMQDRTFGVRKVHFRLVETQLRCIADSIRRSFVDQCLANSFGEGFECDDGRIGGNGVASRADGSFASLTDGVIEDLREVGHVVTTGRVSYVLHPRDLVISYSWAATTIN